MPIFLGFVLLLLNSESYFYIVATIPLSDVWSAEFFLPICSLSSQYLSQRKCFNFVNSKLAIFFHVLDLWWVIQELLAIQGYEGFSLMCSLKSLIIVCFTFKPMNHFKLMFTKVCIFCTIYVQLFSTLCWKTYASSSKLSFHLNQKIYWTYLYGSI